MLGPLLFCLYINDGQHLFDNNDISHILYADELQIYVQVPFNQLEEGINQLSAAVQAVWTGRGRPVLN